MCEHEGKSRQKAALKILEEIALLTLAANVTACGMYLFIFGKNFTPAGVDGISTMLQSVTNVNAGVYILCINIPFLIAGWFVLNKKYVIYTVLYTAENSFLLFLLSNFQHGVFLASINPTLSSVIAAAVLGISSAFMLILGGSTGGIVIIAGIVHKKNERIKLENALLFINIVIIGLAYVVFGNEINAVLLSVLYSIIYSKTIGLLLHMPAPFNGINNIIIKEDKKSSLKYSIPAEIEVTVKC